jgi:hypothetical protein
MTSFYRRTVSRKPNTHDELTDERGRHLQLHSQDLKNTRDLRTLLLEAAYEMQAQPDFVDASISLFGCSLAKKRVEMEIEQFKSVAHPSIAGRIFVHDIRDAQAHTAYRKPTTASQEAVVAYLLQRYLQKLPGVSISAIAAETQASVPTVYKALNTYKHCVEKNPEDKTLRLRQFMPNDWLYWTQRVNQLSSVYFIDRSGSPRSTTRLSKELARLERDDLAIGGLVGAIHHLPVLDATNSPQLDILVHGTRRADLSFISEIDPGLERFEGRADMANVVVHFIDRPNPLFVRQEGQNWGGLPDCIANMQKAGLTHQVNDVIQLIRESIANN